MTIYPPLEIPETLAAGPGPGNTDLRVLERFAKTGVADHMQKDVLRGMIEAKEMLRELWGTKNVYTPTAWAARASAGSIACSR
jgi:alanine-glyoxylate transaminase/serine-glyoxylate transaminase/serine-pyruvate transaminase